MYMYICTFALGILSADRDFFRGGLGLGGRGLDGLLDKGGLLVELIWIDGRGLEGGGGLLGLGDLGQ